MSPEELLEWLRDSSINVMHCGPTLLTTLLSTQTRIRRLPNLRLTLLSGEFLHVSIAARWQRRFGKQTTLVNLYGATEATMIQFFHVLTPEDLKRDFIPIGRPLPDVKVLLVDEKGNRCNAGELGEIWIGGDTIGLGYLQDNQATRNSFVYAEFADGWKGLAYRTGDLAIRHADGIYQLFGRKDDQLKIRGVRVEPREVEDQLIGFPLVAACAVKVVERFSGELNLVAYIVPESQYAPAAPDMRAYLRKRVPAQMVPSKFVFLNRLPLTETGKVDRKLLPEPDWSAGDTGKEAVMPSSPLELTLAGYWTEILGVTNVGVHDNFMDLGGHSLSAMHLCNKVCAGMNLEIGIIDVFRHPTIATLAKLIKDRTSASHGVPADGGPWAEAGTRGRPSASARLTRGTEEPLADRNHLGEPIGFPVEGWRGCSPPPRTAMEGRYCRVEPLDPDRHAADLHRTNQEDAERRIWTYLPYGPFETLEVYRAWMEEACLGDDPLFHAIIDRNNGDKTDGSACGVASYMGIEPPAGVIEVGHVNFAPRLQNTRAATEVMYLMMRRVFDELGYRRYEWKCDALNARSCRAAERLGFQREGIFRQATINKGRNRDTAWYAIIDKDWPAVRHAFETWLDPANFCVEGRQRRSLSALMVDRAARISLVVP
jgi:RimJ/RimL family protein N-acetyltransferase